MLLRISIFILVSHLVLFAQNEKLVQYNQYRNKTNETAMLFLGGWAMTNIAVSSTLYGTGNASQKYFHQMNIVWNFVNLSIAGLGWFHARKADPHISWEKSIQAQTRIEKILLFNAGLDVAYIMTGFYLRERSLRSAEQGPRLKGYGHSLILQGSFLFIFDLTAYFFQVKNPLPLPEVLTQVYFLPYGLGISFAF